jgi:hypothetical protein
VKKVGYDADAGTEDDSAHSAAKVLDTDSDTFWRSRSYNDENATDWVQIHVPQGRYASFYLWNEYPHLEGYLSIYMRARSDGQPCMFGDLEVTPDTWVDIGLGTVPGALGGKPYVKLFTDMPNDRGYTHTFGYTNTNMPIELICGDDTAIRMHYRHLRNPPGGDGGYYAGVKRMIALKRSIQVQAKKRHWVMVDDTSDIVRVVLRWAGFKEWEVENSGVRLSKPWVVDRSSVLLDIINQIKENTDFLFFMGDPSDNGDNSLGVPIFRHTNAVRDEQGTIAVNDQHLLTGIQAKLSEEPLSTIIRMRGATIAKDLDDIVKSRKHVGYTYRPPWSERLAGVIKHVLHYDTKLKTVEDCQFACYYAALQEALQSATATIQLPGFPGIELDDFASLFDEGTGLSTRLWASNRSSTFRSGEQTTWTMTLGGSLVDMPDIQGVVNDINQAVRSGEP